MSKDLQKFLFSEILSLHRCLSFQISCSYTSRRTTPNAYVRYNYQQIIKRESCWLDLGTVCQYKELTSFLDVTKKRSINRRCKVSRMYEASDLWRKQRCCIRRKINGQLVTRKVNKARSNDWEISSSVFPPLDSPELLRSSCNVFTTPSSIFHPQHPHFANRFSSHLFRFLKRERSS